MRRYSEAVELFERVNNEAAAGDSAARKSWLDITRLDSALLSESEKQDALLFMEATAARTKKSTKKKKAAAPFSAVAFYSYAATLLRKLKSVHKKAFAANDSTFEKPPSVHMLRTKTSSPSLKAAFLIALSLFSHDPSDRRPTLLACAKGRPQRLNGVVSTHFLPQREMVALKIRENRCLSSLTPTDSRRLEKCMSSKLGRFDSGLLPVTPPREQSLKCGRGVSSNTVTTITGRESTEGARF